MNDDTYTPCTNCGRPMKYCKGQCCGKPQGCDCKEYGPAVCGVIRQRQPECPYTAVIPSMVVEHADNLKDLCDTFVHVSDLNTTFYIDDKHRTIITWAGPVEYDNYDLAANSLGLRSQFLLDFANDRGAYYDKTGNYKVFNFGNGGGGGGDCCDIMTLTVDINEASFVRGIRGSQVYGDAQGNALTIYDFEVPVVSFTDVVSGDEYTPEEVFNMLNNGQRIKFNGVPLGCYEDGGVQTLSKIVYADGVELDTKSVVSDGYGRGTYFSDSVFTHFPSEYVAVPLGVSLAREGDAGRSTPRYVFVAQGFVRAYPPNSPDPSNPPT